MNSSVLNCKSIIYSDVNSYLMVNWHLLPGEKKIHETAISRKVFVKFYLGGFLLLGLAIASYFSASLGFTLPIDGTMLSVVFLAISVILLYLGENNRTNEMILITTERILVRKYDSNTRDINVEAIPFDKLTNVRVKQTLAQRIMNIGDVIFIVVSSEHVLKDIDSPYKIEKAVYKIIEKEKVMSRQQFTKP